jgi:hypothetical protein
MERFQPPTFVTSFIISNIKNKDEKIKFVIFNTYCFVSEKNLNYCYAIYENKLYRDNYNYNYNNFFNNFYEQNITFSITKTRIELSKINNSTCTFGTFYNLYPLNKTTKLFHYDSDVYPHPHHNSYIDCIRVIINRKYEQYFIEKYNDLFNVDDSDDSDYDSNYVLK